MAKKDYTIKLLRVIATLLVILGHSNFYSISTSVSGLGYDISMSIVDHSKFWTLSSYFVGIIYSCHMQLFFVISGYVFSLCMKNKRYKNFSALATAKFHRLVVPYIVVTILYNTPILMYANYFSYNIRNILLYFIGYGKNHLWYLIALFFIFLLVYALQTFQKRVSVSSGKNIFVITFLGALLIYSLIDCRIIKITEFAYFDRVAKYFVWFLLGMILYEMNDTSNQYFNVKRRRCLAIILFFVWVVSYLIGSNKIRSTITSFSGVLFFYVSCGYIEARYRIAESNKLLSLIDKYSLDIYLYGVPLNYLILAILAKMGGRIELNNVQSLLLFLFRFWIQLLGGIIIGKLVENSKAIIKRKKL